MILAENEALIAKGEKGFLSGSAIDELKSKLKSLELAGLNIEGSLRKSKAKEQVAKIADEVERITKEMTPLNNALDAMAMKLELLHDLDFSGKIDVNTNMFDAVNSQLSMLTEQYSKLLSIQPQTAEEASNLSGRLADVSSKILGANRQLIQHRRQVELLKAQQMSNNFNNEMKQMDGMLGLFKHNIKMLEGGLLSGTDISFKMNILPEIPESVFEKERSELDKLVEQQRNHEADILRIRNMSFAEQSEAKEEFIKELGNFSKTLDEKAVSKNRDERCKCLHRVHLSEYVEEDFYSVGKVDE